MGLDLYADKLLTRKVRVELCVVALALVFVFVFELAAWSFFFNGLLVGDMHTAHLLGTPAAVGLALIFAGTVLYFERQVIVADTVRLKRRDRARAKRVRVIAIFVGAFVVAHAVDLLAFRDPIDRQLHGRAVQAHLAKLAADLAEMRTTLRPGAEEVAHNANEINRVRQEIGAANGRLGTALENEGRYRAAAGVFRQRTALAPRQPEGLPPSPEDRRDALTRDRQVADFVGGQAAATTSVAAIRTDIDRLTKELETLGKERKRLDAAAQHSRRVLQQLASRLAGWTAELNKADPGAVEEVWEAPSFMAGDRHLWAKDWQGAFEFDEPRRSFFEKLTALYGLFHSQPAAGGRGPHSPWVYIVAFGGIHLAAMFVPFLVFTIKWFFTSNEVNAYFSTWHEAHAGDPEAQLMLNVEARVRESLANLPGPDEG